MGSRWPDCSSHRHTSSLRNRPGTRTQSRRQEHRNTHTDETAPACAAAEVCDGVEDEDCDGTVDESCGRCPLMTVTCPTGCCAVDSWAVGTGKSTGAEIAVDPAGNIFFAYTKVSSGGTWQSALAIYDAVPGTWREVPLGGGTYRNRIRIDAMGRVHVANPSADYPQKIMYRRSDDHGVTFTTPVSVGVLNNSGSFDMEIDSAGRPHVVYEGATRCTTARTFATRTWSVRRGRPRFSMSRPMR